MANALSNLGKSKAKKAKSKIPVVEQEILSQAVEDWLDAKEECDEAKANMNSAEEEFLPFAESARIAASQEVADRVTSVRIVTSKGKVLVTSAERFSDVSDESLPGLRLLFGKRNSARFFRTGTISKISDNATDETIDRMVKVLVEAGFDLAELFDVSQKTVVTKAFLSESVTDKTLAEKRRMSVNDGDLKPYKSRVRAG